MHIIQAYSERIYIAWNLMRRIFKQIIIVHIAGLSQRPQIFTCQ